MKKDQNSIVKIVDKTFSRRSPKKEYDKDNVEFIIKVANSLKSDKIGKIRQATLDMGVMSLGFEKFIREFYSDCGAICDFEKILTENNIHFVER